MQVGVLDSLEVVEEPLTCSQSLGPEGSGWLSGVAELVVAIADCSLFASALGGRDLWLLREVIEVHTDSGGVLSNENLVDRADGKVGLLKAGEHLPLEEGWLDGSGLQLSSLEGGEVAAQGG